MVGEKNISKFWNWTWSAGKERTITERNKDKIFREVGSGPPAAEKMLPERNVSIAFGIPNVPQCQS